MYMYGSPRSKILSINLFYTKYIKLRTIESCRDTWCLVFKLQALKIIIYWHTFKVILFFSFNLGKDIFVNTAKFKKNCKELWKQKAKPGMRREIKGFQSLFSELWFVQIPHPCHKFKVLATTAALRLKRVIHNLVNIYVQVILFLRLICNQTRSFCFNLHVGQLVST